MCGLAGYAYGEAFEGLNRVEIAGSLSTTAFDNEAWWKLFAGQERPLATVTVRRHACGWRRIVLSLQRKPRSWEQTYVGVEFGAPEIGDDGSVRVGFTGNVR